MSVHLFGLQCQGADVLKFISLFLLTNLKVLPTIIDYHACGSQNAWYHV